MEILPAGVVSFYYSRTLGGSGHFGECYIRKLTDLSALWQHDLEGIIGCSETVCLAENSDGPAKLRFCLRKSAFGYDFR